MYINLITRYFCDSLKTPIAFLSIKAIQVGALKLEPQCLFSWVQTPWRVLELCI